MNNPNYKSTSLLVTLLLLFSLGLSAQHKDCLLKIIELNNKGNPPPALIAEYEACVSKVYEIYYKSRNKKNGLSTYNISLNTLKEDSTNNEKKINNLKANSSSDSIAMQKKKLSISKSLDSLRKEINKIELELANSAEMKEPLKKSFEVLIKYYEDSDKPETANAYRTKMNNL